jgi:type VI secretion system Hcp family effector
VITVGGSQGLTIATPTIRSNAHAVGQVAVDPGQRDALGFDFLTVSFAPSTKSTGGGGGAGKSSVHDIEITKVLDKSSPKLLSFCVKGTHIKKVTIELLKSGKVLLKYTLSSVLVSSYRVSPSAGGETPQGSLTLNFGSMQTSA